METKEPEVKLKGKYYKCRKPDEKCMYRVKDDICTFSIGSADAEDRGVCSDAEELPEKEPEGGEGELQGKLYEITEALSTDCQNCVSKESCSDCMKFTEHFACLQSIVESSNKEAVQAERERIIKEIEILRNKVILQNQHDGDRVILGLIAAKELINKSGFDGGNK